MRRPAAVLGLHPANWVAVGCASSRRFQDLVAVPLHEIRATSKVDVRTLQASLDANLVERLYRARWYPAGEGRWVSDPRAARLAQPQHCWGVLKLSFDQGARTGTIDFESRGSCPEGQESTRHEARRNENERIVYCVCWDRSGPAPGEPEECHARGILRTAGDRAIWDVECFGTCPEGRECQIWNSARIKSDGTVVVEWGCGCFPPAR
jgi:hypothetical protein